MRGHPGAARAAEGVTDEPPGACWAPFVGQRVANSDANQPLTNYHYKQDTFGYGYHRTDGAVPSKVDPNQEPAEELGQKL